MSAENPNYQHVLIKGIPVSTGEQLGIRMEFSTWATDNPKDSIQVSLFIRALQKFYDKPYTDRLSYFQVAGIHGYPGNRSWDNSESPPKSDRPGPKIYCTHNKLTFPTWHRPYMALFEQTMYQLMDEALGELEFPMPGEKDEWTRELKKWRLPYWNWAIKPQVPDLFQNDIIKIRLPRDSRGNIVEPKDRNNPLFRYQLNVNGLATKMGDPELGEYKINDVVLNKDPNDPKTPPIEINPLYPWSQCSGTSRWGINSSLPLEKECEGVNDFAKISDAIEGHKYEKDNSKIPEMNNHPVSDLVYRLLSNVCDWESFSSTLKARLHKPTEWTQWISLEYIHNNLHLFNPDRWFPQDSEALASLLPFHGKFERGVDYYNSVDIRKSSSFGYQYDVLLEKNDKCRKDYVARIRREINKSYYGTGDVLQHDKGGLFKHNDGSPLDDYIANVEYNRYGYRNGEPYTIHFFFGLPPTQDEISTGTRSVQQFPRHVGSLFTFSSPIGAVDGQSGELPHCVNCAQQRDDGTLSRASVPLTIPLYSDAVNRNINGITNLKPEHVSSYLASKRGLSWLAVSTDGQVISWSELPDTKVFVLHGKAKRPAERPEDSTEFLAYSEYEPMPTATIGKEAGASQDDYDSFLNKA
ncbi:hypothetical protein CGLO_13112 [Colletotrichum gloeosporioides Cg-14]|uniref:tyrosinase n=1 Tax=Colletotrichum gloeosporioides (strain Cg-14) TaxID=1237896 RepID=T0LHS0_COLGC|nr:hypothetical protein CGLO_13112 [Colletotrichum gloeosporioides Cg-14]